MPKKKVVVTGASGYVASRMLPGLRDRYDLTLLDVKTTDREGVAVEGIQITDLLDDNRDAYRAHFSGADTVVHCGFVGSAMSGNPFPNELANVRMAYNVYQTCAEEGVARVVVMSSNHAADYYERLIWSDRMEFVTPDMLPLSDNFYGWAKSAYELLGFTFASGNVTEGKKLEVVQLRIGAPRESDAGQYSADNLKKMHRGLGAYLSARDQTQLVVKSIDTENIEDENGVPFQIFYGISANSHNFWSLVNARKVIGYAPEDNSALLFVEEVGRVMGEAKRLSGRAGAGESGRKSEEAKV